MTDTQTETTIQTACNDEPRKRHAAGEDPRKREQILKGAWRVFMEQGFDAASMNSICKAAGVSKGTLYVYFQNKEDLFVALVEEKRRLFFLNLGTRLAKAGSVEELLTEYGIALGTLLTSEEVIRAQRIIIGVGERMPWLAKRFWEAGATHSMRALSDWLVREREAGTLAVEDPIQAGQVFIDLTVSGLWRRRLFGEEPNPPSPEEIERNTAEAVRIFMAAYGAPKT
ncbi:TetR/AcrR family transcriptional regulator [Chachezhania sediminis]|uniref:TetR/AcrR family transcriptional regulator n=1 Tax=Chachezhania sediminis TaxID=2599291 RepID=UPI00131B0210|nr:TetR/AcrR family transcriptional regulator [Chachezhania sediminis]